MTVKLNILIRIEIEESPSLSGSLCLTVDEEELFPRSKCLVWMMIGFKDRDLS